MDKELLYKAFRAGFDFSAEGFNGEYSHYSEEELDKYLRELFEVEMKLWEKEKKDAS